MEVIKHDIDPNGDLLIILRNPNIQNMIPDDVPDALPTQWHHSSVSSGLPAFDTSGTKEVEIQLRVSSYHMILASPVFEKMLNGSWREANTPEAPASPDLSPSPASLYAGSVGSLPFDRSTTPPDQTGAAVPASETALITSVDSLTPLRHVSATEWNANALVVILNIIHGRHQAVPRNVSLNLFAHVATIVDYYQCERSVGLAALQWRRDLFYKDISIERLVVWLYIAWVFSWDSFFSSMAGVALRRSNGLKLIKTYDLPVGELVAAMERKRQSLFSRLLEALDDLVASLDCSSGCNHICSPLMLGSLFREKHALTLLDPPIGHSLIGFSLYDVADEVENFRNIKSGHKCSIRRMMKPIIDKVFKDARNVNLSEYKSLVDMSKVEIVSS